MHRFGKMFGFEVFGAFEIRYRAGHFENPNNCARALVVCDLDVGRPLLARGDVAWRAQLQRGLPNGSDLPELGFCGV